MVNLFNESGQDINELAQIEKLLKFIIKREKLKKCAFNVIIVEDEEIKKINKKYRNLNEPTDVLSFELDFNFLNLKILGDVYISIDRARDQALKYNHSLLRELSFLTVHGLLHLLGYNHETKEEEKVMFEKQELILSEYGIKK